MIEMVIVCLGVMFNYPDRDTVEMVEVAAKKYRLPSIVFHALIMQESSYRIDAINPEDPSYGPGMLMTKTALRECSLPGYLIMDTALNIDCSAKYLSRQYKKYGDIEKALSAYNAGVFTKNNSDYVDKIKHWTKELSCEQGKNESMLKQIGMVENPIQEKTF